MPTVRQHGFLHEIWRSRGPDPAQRVAAVLRGGIAAALGVYIVAYAEAAPRPVAQTGWEAASRAGPIELLVGSETVSAVVVVRPVAEAPGVENPFFGEPTTLITALKDIFLDEGIPRELVWIAEVESGFNTEAVSSSGAAGLFQLMPQTAERFGVRVAMDEDERFNPALNARAAARYLKALRLELGTWPLAVAGYHAGEGCVRRALEAVRGRRYSDIAYHLPATTQDYVYRVLNVISAAEGIAAVDLPAPTS